MKKNVFKTLSLFFCCFLPLVSYADIRITNNTQFYGTANLTFSPCSSSIGDGGVLKPHQSLTVSSSIIKMFCGNFSCTANVYLSKNCSGKKIATAKVSAKKGIISINNMDQGELSLSGNGNNVVINPA